LRRSVLCKRHRRCYRKNSASFDESTRSIKQSNIVDVTHQEGSMLPLNAFGIPV